MVDPADLDENLAAAWRLMTSATPGHPPAEDHEVLMTSTGAAVDFFNPCIVKRKTADPGAALGRIEAHYRSLGLAYLVWLRDGLDAELVAASQSSGLEVRAGPPAMALSPLRPAPAGPAGLAIRRVTTEADADDVAVVSAAANGIPPELARAVVSVDLAARPDAAVFVGRVDGVAVATSTLVISGSTAGIYGVATEPRWRRRGYGQALTWSAVAEGAARGCTSSLLQTSDLGRSIYERMGFVLVGAYLHIAGPPAT